MRGDRSLILARSVDTLFHTALLFSVFLLFAGHNAPGGGFIGGLVAGTAFVLRYVDGGAGAVRRAAPVAPQLLLGAGLAVTIATGALAWVWGGAFLESAKVEANVPVLGSVKGTSALPFDIGVYLVVVGLVLLVVQTLGGEAET